jgi:hypothetical protein
MPSHNTKVVKSTTEDMLLSPTETPQVEVLEEKVKMKKQLGLLEGVAIILGIIFGSGEFSKSVNPN